MAKKLTSTKAKKILHDKTVHGKPLTDKQRKFFGAVASGAIPQAQVGRMLAPITGEDVAKFFDMFSVPQKAVTKMVTGKYQTPSEAMDIKNPVGAFATDMILDPINLMGAGAVAKTTGAYKNAYKLNPWAFKANPEAGYRMIGGKEGYLDALTSGQIRPTGVYEHAHFNIGQPLNPNRLSAEELIQAGSPGGYKGPYMAEMQQGTWQRMSDAFSNSPEMQEQFRLLGKDKDVWQHPLFGNIKVDDPRLKLYKEHWLKGYKEVPKTKKKAQNGIEGTMGGLTDQGFNYNGAWGGTMQMGGAMPGAVGFTYARIAGAAPANGPYAKKTKASAQRGKKVKEDSNLENIVEIIDPTGVTSWDDVYRSYKKTGMSPETGLEIFGALPMIGKVGKIGKFAEAAAKTFAATGRQKRNVKAVAETLKGVGKYGPAAGRSTDAYQTYDQWENGGSMKYYQEGLDFKPKTISQDGSKSPKKRTLILAENDPEFWDNPDSGKAENAVNPFITEAAGIKKYVNKYFPNEDVEIIPTYKQNIKEALAKSDPNTRLVVMGHSGNRMFGIPTTEFIESVGNTKYENCYAGICYGDDLYGIGQKNPDKELIGKVVPGRFPESYNLQNFNVRSNDEKWLGFAPVDRGGEEGFRDSFFRRTSNPEVIRLQEELKKIWSNTNIEYEKKAKVSEPIQSKLNKIFSQNRQTVNLPKAADTKELDYIPIPARTANYGKDPLTFNPQRKKQGGEIPVDPMGYWNPDNVGEPVTIPSNEITMEGVYQPLLGISDTGDTQMMYPGEDYTFDGDYVTEYPMAKGGISVNEADAQPIKKLDQLLNFTNYNDMATAKKGKKLSKAQLGDSLTSINSALGDMGGIGGASTQLLGGIQQLMEEQRQKKKTKQFVKLSEVAGKADTSRDITSNYKGPRPEDLLVEPGQIGSPYGTGMDFLQMEYGGFIGGNPTEIQNMYNPGDLYSDLGYEPLEDSTKVKQFKKGGKAQFGTVQAGQLGSTLGSFLGGGGGQQSGAGQIGSALGGVVGNIFLPGFGGAIGAGLGGALGGLIGGQSQKKMEQMQRQAQGNLGVAALQQSLQGSAFAEHGGELKYLSHTWQPQTITKFGDYDVKDLLAPPKDADMLRAGGQLEEYTAPSEAAMSTERPMEMGGNLTIDNRGDIDFLGYNPETAKTGASGYIGITRGPSHDNGGFNLNYSGSGVEVEGNETVIERKEGGPVDGNKSLVILGDMKTGAFGNEILEGVNERLAKKVLKGKKIEDVKFKQLGNQVAKLTGRLNKSENKFIDLADSVDGNSPFDLLQLNTAKTAISGINMQYKGLNKFQQNAIDVQSGYHDAAEERGYDDTPKFLSDIKKGKIKDLNMAKFGAKMETAQNGKKKPFKLDITSFMPTAAQIAAEDAAFRAANPEPKVKPPIPLTLSEQAMRAGIGPTIDPMDLQKLDGTPAVVTKDKNNFNLMDLAQQLNPYTRPLIKNPPDPGQFAEEMLTIGTNELQAVQAQQYRPMLEEVPTISFQDQLNEIQAEANAARRLAGNNPAAQSAIAAQAAAAKNKVLGEQLRTNQALQLESRRRNLATLNDATLKNLAILDQQFTRQAQAMSATKAQAREAIGSIADKIARNKAETLQANVMSNMYPQYTFGPKGRIFNTGLTTFNTGMTGADQTPTDAKGNDLLPIYGKKGNITGYKVKEIRNGSIVKAIKNL